MANDQNKSGNQNPPNGLADPDSILAKIQQREREAGRQTVREIQLGAGLEPKELAVNELQSVMGVAAGSPAEKIVGEQISRLQNELGKAYNTIDVGERSRRERSERVLRRDIERQYGPSAVRGETIRSSASTQNVARGAGMVDVPYSRLEAQRSTAEMNIAGYTREAIGHTEGIYANEGVADPRKVAAITELEKKIRSEQNSLGGIEAGLKYQKSLGMDPQSRLETVGKLAMRARSQQNEFKTAEEIRSTGGVTISGKDGEKQFVKAGMDAQSELPARTKAVIDALDALSKAAKAGEKDLTKWSEAVETAAAEQEKVAAAAAGGGASGSQKLSALAGGFQAAAAFSQAVFVDQRLKQVSNVNGLANIENQKYDMYRKAGAGDIMSQMQLGQFGAAQGFGNELANGALTTLAAQGLGGIAQTGAGLYQMAEGAGQKNPVSFGIALATGNAGAATQETIQGGMNAVQGAAMTGVTALDAARHLSTTQARIAGVQSYMQASQALSYVSAEQLQGFSDYSRGLGGTARGLGSGGAAFINKSLEFAKGTANAIGGQDSAFTRARMSPEEFNKMSQAGVAAMGGAFNTDQVFAARGLERSGYGTKEENMQRMATLAAAGSNNPQAGLGSVLESAVSKGMDSSKAVSALVDQSAAMAASSVGRSIGIDTSGASAAMLAAMVTGPNKEASLARAADLQGNIKSIGTNVDASFAGMVANSRLSKTLGIDTTAAIRLQRVETETLKSLDTEEKRVKFFKEQNVSIAGKDTKAMVNSMLDSRAATLVEGGGIGFTENGRDALLKRVKSFHGAMKISDLTQKEADVVSSGVTSGTYKSVTEALNALNAVYAGPSAKDQNKTGAIMAGKGGSKEQQTMDDLLTQSAKQQAAASAEATKTFKTARETFSELTKMAKSIEKLTDTGFEGKAKTAAAESAATFGDGAAKIDLAGTKMLDAARILAGKAGLGSDKNDIQIPDALKKMMPGQKQGTNPKTGNGK